MCYRLPDRPAFANAIADFSLNLYKEIAKDAKSNIFISPFSISCALSMTYAGAAGETKAEMRKMLFGHLEKPDEELHGTYAEMMGLTSGQGVFNQKDAPVKLHLANRIFAHDPFVANMLDTFNNTLKKNYDTDLVPVNFGEEEKARTIINSWVQEKTNDKIKNLIPPGILDSMTRLVLVNAIYFKGDWKFKFDPANTGKLKFYAAEDKEVDVDMMHLKGAQCKYMEDEHLQVLGMPYTGEHLLMFVFLPRKRDGLKEMEGYMVGKVLLDHVQMASHDRKIDQITFPKFKLEETVGLVPVLQNLGCHRMFGDADFSGINGGKDLYVSAVIHKAFIEVNEEGTEAAAATAVVIAKRSISHNPRFIADHPFMFSIIDIRTYSILFLGRYMGPQ